MKIYATLNVVSLEPLTAVLFIEVIYSFYLNEDKKKNEENAMEQIYLFFFSNIYFKNKLLVYKRCVL